MDGVEFSVGCIENELELIRGEWGVYQHIVVENIKGWSIEAAHPESIVMRLVRMAELQARYREVQAIGERLGRPEPMPE